jgi:RNA polymerase sigma-B factor
MLAAAALNRSEKTTRLFALRASATGEERAAIEDQLIELSMTMAADATRRFHRRGIASEDIEQVAYVGLVKAVKAFDPEHGYDFLSFAIPTIRGEVRRHFRDIGWAVRPPRPIQEAQSKIIASEGDLYQQYGRAPRPSEIAEHLGLELDVGVEALGADGCFAPASLDAPHNEEDNDPIARRLGYEDAQFDVAEARAVLAPLLNKLSKRDKLIIEMRFFRGCTQSEIGEAIGVTQMQVSRLLSRLMARMREELGTALVA